MPIAPAYSAAQVAIDGSLYDEVSEADLTTSGTISESSDADGSYIQAATQPTNYVNVGLLQNPIPGTTWVFEIKTTQTGVTCLEGTANTGTSLIEGIYLNAADYLATNVLDGSIGLFLRGTNGLIRYWRTPDVNINDGEKHGVAIEYDDSSNVKISVDGVNQTLTATGTGVPTVSAGNVEYTISLFARNSRGTRDLLTTGKIYRYARFGADGYDLDALSNDPSIIFGEPDVSAPILTSPIAEATGATTATATVTTDDGNGTLYFLASTNSTESAATVKAALSQSVTEVGEQSISLSALDPETTYYVHFVQINGAGLESASVISTSAITTPAIVYPEISATVAASSTSAVSATVTTDTAGGTIYGVLSESATVMTAAAIKSGADDTATVTTAGNYTLDETGLATWTQYYWHIVHEDTDGLMSNVLTIPVRTLDISISLAFPDTAPATLLTVQVWSKIPKKADVEGLY